MESRLLFGEHDAVLREQKSTAEVDEELNLLKSAATDTRANSASKILKICTDLGPSSKSWVQQLWGIQRGHQWQSVLFHASIALALVCGALNKYGSPEQFGGLGECGGSSKPLESLGGSAFKSKQTNFQGS